MEAFISTKVEALNIKVPSILEIKQIDDHWAFKFPNIKGSSLYDLLLSDTDNIEAHMDLLVDVQTSIHLKKCPMLPIQKEKLTDYVKNSNLDKSLKLDLLDMLNSSPKHKKLCHGNFTPHNVILSGEYIYITDVNHATQGNASADVARTYLWMQINLPQYADLYLSKFCDKTSTSSQYVRNWIPIVAAARLAKNNPEEIKMLKQNISVMEY